MGRRADGDCGYGRDVGGSSGVGKKVEQLISC